jgi:hypothetical protein
MDHGCHRACTPDQWSLGLTEEKSLRVEALLDINQRCRSPLPQGRANEARLHRIRPFTRGGDGSLWIDRKGKGRQPYRNCGCPVQSDVALGGQGRFRQFLLEFEEIHCVQPADVNHYLAMEVQAVRASIVSASNESPSRRSALRYAIFFLSFSSMGI